MTTNAMTLDELLVAVRNGALDVSAAELMLNALRSPDTASAGSAAIGDRLQEDLLQMLSLHLDLQGSQIDVDASFGDLGIDSLVGVQWIRQINERYGTSLSAACVHEHPTVSKFSQHLLLSIQAKESRGAREDEHSVAPAERASAGLLSDEPIPREPAPRPAQRLRSPSDIAVVAIVGRYPKSDSLRSFWSNLAEARDCVTEVPPRRWSLEGFYEADPEAAASCERSYCKWGGFLDDVNTVDREFFRPWQQDVDHRGVEELMFLQAVWSLFESAAYTRETLRTRLQGNVGVYLGARPDSARGVFPAALASGISSFFQLQGPCLAIDTMSASSMTAVHTACAALECGDCEMAIAAGLNILERESYVRMSRAGILGSHAEARSFAGADGILPAEGIGAVLLKRLECAVEDGDPILAVIKSTLAGNADSRAADPVPKARLIARNLARAGVDPRTVSYVEAAAAGHAAADAIELEALRDVFEEFDVAPQSCAIGSVKAFVGHALSVSGLSQLTRVVLQLNRRLILPGLHPSTPSALLDRTPFFAPREVTEWKRPLATTPLATIKGRSAEHPRRALINSYGGGGAMVSVLVEETPEELGALCSDEPSRREIVVLSARAPGQLLAYIQQLLLFLDEQPTSLQALAFTLQVGRESMEHRWVAVVGSMDELKTALRATLREPARPGEGVMLASSTGAKGLDAEHLNAYAAERLLKKIAAHWVQGGRVDWSTLWRVAPRRILAPSYPFSTPAGGSQ
jgi:polyketide synthase PksN